LFEGEPYTLWNIRDLARHAGLAVEQSFVFQANAYPGYRHARTLGMVKGRDGKESGGAWKGEERKSRSYVFVRKGEEPKPGMGKAKPESSSEEESNDEEGDGWDSDEDEELEVITNENDNNEDVESDG
jgi:25S rRNA (uracil2634-N3)-methyltransferase